MWCFRRIGSCHYYSCDYDVDWNRIRYLLHVPSDFFDDPEANEELQSSHSSDAVDPAGSRLLVAGVDDGGPHDAEREIASAPLHEPFAEILGEGVGVGVLPQNLLRVHDDLVERQRLQVLQSFLGVLACVQQLVPFS